MADTDALRPYRRADLPKFDGGDRTYIVQELDKVKTAIALLIDVAKKLEVRIAALEP